MDRLEFETLISDLSSRFINLNAIDLDNEIEVALGRVCELLGIDYAVLWQWSAEGPDLLPTHVYPAQGAVSDPEPLRQELYPWSVREMRAGRITVISSLDEVPPEGAIDRESAVRAGIKSSLCLPLIAGDESIGALALNALRAERQWPETLVKRLQLVAQIFTTALIRRRHDRALSDSEERLSMAADSAGVGLWTLDYGTRIFWATPQARRIFGLSDDEVLTFDRVMAAIHPDDLPLVRSVEQQSWRAPETVEADYRLQLRSSEVRWVASRWRTRLDAAGEPDRMMGLSIDITERKRSEEAFRLTQARLAAGADLAGLGYYEIDYGRRVAWCDDRFRELCGVPPECSRELQILEFWTAHLHPDDVDGVVEERRKLHDGVIDDLEAEYRYLHPVDGEKWIHHLARVSSRGPAGVVAYGALHDVTESKRAEEALHDLSRRLIHAHEEERALLARELHDDVTQRLAVMAIEAGRAELAAPDGAQAATLRILRDGLVRLSEDVHTLAYQLHPSVLEELGLDEALRTECERVGRASGVEISVSIDKAPLQIGRDAALCLFRIAQESLNNVTRHSHAQAASVDLREMDGGFVLSVRDDGEGFDPQIPRMKKSLGLASMRERVRLVNGMLDIESAPRHGTSVIAWVPASGAPR